MYEMQTSSPAAMGRGCPVVGTPNPAGRARRGDCRARNHSVTGLMMCCHENAWQVCWEVGRRPPHSVWGQVVPLLGGEPARVRGRQTTGWLGRAHQHLRIGPLKHDLRVGGAGVVDAAVKRVERDALRGALEHWWWQSGPLQRTLGWLVSKWSGLVTGPWPEKYEARWESKRGGRVCEDVVWNWHPARN